MNLGNYVSLSIDFNKFNDINNMYGYEIGNIIIKRSLTLIKNVLPENSICARLGGDEFVFIIDHCSENIIEELTKRIDNVLKEHEEEIFYSTVTSYGVHSSEQDNLYDMIEKADLKITERKNNFSDNSLHSEWSTLERKLTKNLTSFFKSLRFYKKDIDINFLKKLYVHGISSVGNILENDFKPCSKQIEKGYLNQFSDTDQIEKIYSIFQNSSPSLSEIESIPVSTYEEILNDLIHDPVTGNFSKNYFEDYLLKFCDNQYKIKYFSSSFVKLYNTLFSHSTTDEKDNILVNDLIKYLNNEQNIEFNNELFSKKAGNHFISLGAGDYLIALSPDQDFDNEKINKYIMSHIPKATTLENLLYLTCTTDTYSINKYNYEDCLLECTQQCKIKKDNYKMSIMDEDVITDVLSNIIYDSVEYYSTNILHSNNIKQKTKFLNLFSQVMLQSSQKINKSQDLIK